MSATTEVSSNLNLTTASNLKHRSLWDDGVRRFGHNKLAVAGLIVVVIFFLTAIFGPYFAPYDFRAQDMDNQFQPPSPDHWMGTDALGRDIFSRLIYGARTAALVAVISTSISLLLGVGVGAMAGYMRGKSDEFLMWVTDVTMAVPGLLLAMLINAALKRPVMGWFEQTYERTRNPLFLNTLWLDFVLLFGILALISWPGLARLIRGQVLTIGNTTYVESAHAVGSPTSRILSRHVVPNAMGPLIVAVTAAMGGVIVLESALSWLGIGVPPPNASWGIMLKDSQQMWRTYPHLLVAPAVTIGIISVAFTFLGDGLNDALNPRLTKKG